MSVKLSEIVKQEVIKKNYNFRLVMRELADGFQQCGFFNDPNWKLNLTKEFELKESGVTADEIEIYPAALSDDSDHSFTNGLRKVPHLTPFAVNTQNKNGRGRKRTRTRDDDENLLIPLKDATPSPPRMTRNQKKLKTTSSSSNQNINQVLEDIKSEDGSEISSKANTAQSTVEHVDVFVKQRKQGTTNQLPSNLKCSTVRPTQTTVRSHLQAVVSTMPKASVVSTMPKASVVSKMSRVVSTTVSNTDTLDANVGNNQLLDPLTNITNRRTTRRQTQLLAAYSNTVTNKPIAERRNTFGILPRTCIILTMIDPEIYSSIFKKYNIYVADLNEKYDYLIAERIHRSAKFLSAVLSGKPIVSINWLKEMQKTNTWLDPLAFLLKDEHGEREFNYNLSERLPLNMATERKLFQNYSILITPNTTPRPDALKDVVFSGGGKYLKTSLVQRKGDNVLCVSVDKDKKMWPRLKTKYLNLTDIISVEGLANMIFQNNLDVKDYKLD